MLTTGADGLRGSSGHWAGSLDRLRAAVIAVVERELGPFSLQMNADLFAEAVITELTGLTPGRSGANDIPAPAPASAIYRCAAIDHPDSPHLFRLPGFAPAPGDNTLDLLTLWGQLRPLVAALAAELRTPARGLVAPTAGAP